MNNDLISRSELIKQMGWKLGLGDEENGANVDYMEALEDCKELIDNAPAVEPKQGEWIFNTSFWSCSVCKNSAKTIGYCGDAKFMNEFFKFCPNCGADMRKGGAE